jgi:hypothetical protein
MAFLDGLQDQIKSTIPLEYQPYLPSSSTVQITLRCVVAILTLILFTPHLRTMYYTMTGQPNPRLERLRNRVEYLNGLHDLQEGKVPAANQSETTNKEVKATQKDAGKGGSKRRKA